MSLPMVIQGGMGVAVSDWRLARAVSQLGQLGVVSGTGLDNVLARRLQSGDPDGAVRGALEQFPVPGIARRIRDTYFIPGGKAADAPFKPVPMYRLRPSTELLELTVVANFVEVFLAKAGHTGLIGINLMEKLQLPNLPSLYGAMLAGVDYVLMGAGIPREIPGALDLLAEHQPAALKLHTEGPVVGEPPQIVFDPRQVMGDVLPPLQRPLFLAIVSSVTLAMALARKGTGKVNGFIVEAPTAGGHNAPPRGELQLSERGEPIYGARDAVDPAKMRELGLPFWMAGSSADPLRVQEALDCGAQGVQVGTAFALCRESGLAPALKAELLAGARDGASGIFTDPYASPTGFPFKVAQLDGTLSAADTYAARPRNCDLGYLRTLYQNPDGSFGFRCPAEPVDTFMKKGGTVDETVGRKCLCNGLMSNVGLAQRQRSGYQELPLVTAGDDLGVVGRILAPGADEYAAADVVRYLLTLPDGSPVGSARGATVEA